MKLEVLRAVGERSSDPRLEAWLIIGHVATPRQPRPVQPLEGAELEVDPAVDFDLGDDHRRKPEPANLSPGHESLGFDGDVILAILKGRDLGVVPLSGDAQMQLGNFSVSLAVKNIAASRAFYEKRGFTPIAGDQAQNWLILQNSTSTIGLFQGPKYTRNVLTFNPGWDRTGSTPPDFDDVRDIQRTLKGRGVVPTAAADESSTGPASMMLTDPDGNPILIDQHVPKPRK